MRSIFSISIPAFAFAALVASAPLVRADAPPAGQNPVATTRCCENCEGDHGAGTGGEAQGVPNQCAGKTGKELTDCKNAAAGQGVK